MDLAEIKVYRITHIDNMPHILQNGITHRNSPNHNPNFVAIGDISLINTRDNKQITVDNGDFLNFDAPTITLGNFIPFYFGVKMPMLYVIQNGGNFVTKSTPASKIIYLVCSVSQLIKSGGNYYFSDGHATDNLTTFYDKNRVDDLPKIIDLHAVRESYWGGQDNLNLKRKKQAEFLVSNDIEPNLILGFGCYDETAKNELIGLGVGVEKIKVIPNAYF
jgi:ssDNA thymidine ADP-ribosyltransferase, DarT